MKLNKDYQITLCPSNIDVDALIIKYSETLDYNNDNLQKQKNQLLIVIDRLVKARYNEQKRLNKFDSRVEFPACMSILKEGLREAPRYLDILGKEGIIFNDGLSSTSKCAVYKFENLHAIELLVPKIIFPKKPKPSELIKAAKKQAIYEATLPYQSILADYKKLTVDWDEAEKIINLEYPDGIEDHLVVTKHLQLEYLTMIDEGDTSMWKILSTGRLSNAFAYLKKELRSCLRYDGKPLVELDVKNSIPFCSLIFFGLVDNQNAANNRLILDCIERIKERGYKINSNLYKYHMHTKNRLQNCPFVASYIEDVLNGYIYEKVNAEWSKELKTQYSRNEAKKKLISLFNSPNFIVETNSHWKIFKNMYPSVAEYIYGLNEGYMMLKKQSTIEDNKCAFAYITQGIEVYALLDYIVNKIKDSNSKIPTITLHDGIYTTPENKDVVYSTMLEGYKDIFGFIPKIEFKSCKLNKSL